MAKRINGLESIFKNLDDEPVIQVDQLGFPVLGDDGKPQPSTVKLMLSAVLGRGNSGDPISAIDVAIRLRRSTKQHIELDNDDVTMLVTAVKGDRVLTDLGKAFLLRILDDAKPVKEKD